MANVNIGMIWEDWHPIIMAASGYAVVTYFEDYLIDGFKSGWKLADLYSAVFGWSSIQTGFLFGVYGFIAGKSDGFISAIKRTIAMVRFVRYTRQATFIGFILSIISMPLIVISPSLSSGGGLENFFIKIWFSFFIWAFMLFIRVAFLFGLLLRVPDRLDLPG